MTAPTSHQVLSRKYRPQSFRELVGQEAVTRILTSALVAGKVGHAYLFVGPRGVGKTTTARIFARALNCPRRPEGDPEPCGECPSCTGIAAGSDLDVVEIDGASNSGVDDVRSLREQVGYAAVRARYRIWIVDEVHMLSVAAFNAFLKTLEEPPERVKFVFCTTEDHRLPETFRSRCQRVEFRPVGEAEIAARLEDLVRREGATLEEGVAADIARGALGGLRDAESLLEQLVASAAAGRVTRADLEALSGRAPAEALERWASAVDRGDAAGALSEVAAALAAGARPGILLDQWLDLWRRRLAVAAAGDGAHSLARAARSIDILLGKRQHLRFGADGALVAEVATVELARLPDARDLDRLIEALRGAPGSVSADLSPSRPVAAPAPVAPPPAPRPTPSAPPDLAGVVERWGEIAARVGAEDPALGEAVRRSRPQALEEGGRVLLLEPADAWGRAALERREGIGAFRRAAARVLNAEISPRVVAAPPAPKARSSRDLRDHPVVRRVAEVTEGTLLDLAVAPEATPAGEAEATPQAAADASRATPPSRGGEEDG
jgi:DNA polymerase-3 subunit gamma/tau